MENFNSVKNYFGEPPTFVGTPRGFTRNSVEFYAIGDRKITAKKYLYHDLFLREKLTYEILGKNNYIKTPRVIFWGDNFALFETIGNRGDINPALALSDWAEIHARYYNRVSGLPNILANPLKLEKRLERVISKTRSNTTLFCARGETFANLLEQNKDYFLRNDKITLVHNDLIPRNFINMEGDNYYFDFEFFGIGNPAQDVVPLLLDYPDMLDEFIGNKKFGKSLHIDGDSLRLYSLLRACDILNLMESRGIPEKRRIAVRNRFFGVLDKLF